jgi:hypothetical protein
MCLFPPYKEATMSHIFAVYLSCILTVFSVSASAQDQQIEPDSRYQIQALPTEIELTKRGTPRQRKRSGKPVTYACDQCVGHHLACSELKDGETACKRCQSKKIECTWKGKEQRTQPYIENFTPNISEGEQPETGSFKETKEKYRVIACDQCKKKHTACKEDNNNKTQCAQCIKRNIPCSWEISQQLKVNVHRHPNQDGLSVKASPDELEFKVFSFFVKPRPSKPNRVARRQTRDTPYPDQRPSIPEDISAIPSHNWASDCSPSQAALNHQGYADQSHHYSAANISYFPSAYGEGYGFQGFAPAPRTGSYPLAALNHQGCAGQSHHHYSAADPSYFPSAYGEGYGFQLSTPAPRAGSYPLNANSQYQALMPMPQVEYHQPQLTPVTQPIGESGHYCMGGSDCPHDGGAKPGFGEYVNSCQYHNPNNPSSSGSLSSLQNQDDGLGFFNDDN